MMTATYEQQMGLRDNHQRPDGYQVSVSRTLSSPTARVYKAFVTESERDAWLGENGLQVRKASPNNANDLEGWEDEPGNQFLCEG